MIKYLLKVSILVLSFSLFSCSKNSEKQIRLVDLQGKPHDVKTRVPELNANLIQSQNSQSPVFAANNFYAEKPLVQESSSMPNPMDSFPNQMQNQAPNKYATADYNAASANVVEQNLQAPENPNAALSSNSAPDKTKIENGDSKILATIGQKQESDVAEYSLNESSKTNVKKSSKKSLLASKKSKSAKKLVSFSGFFVQVGAFSNAVNAENSLNEMQKFSEGKIEEVDLKDKKLYRVLLGPFSTKSKALQTMNDIKSSGHDAVIVRKK